MKNRGMRRGRPGPDADIAQGVADLQTSLKSETRFMPNVALLNHLVHDDDAADDEDAFRGRDNAARKLRFLKTWFDLPSEAFITSLNLLDRFITKLKVKSVHLDCASIACLYVASELHGCPVNAADLVAMSQVKCTISDLERMSEIVRDKLTLRGGEMPLTAVHFLDHFIHLLDIVIKQQNIKSIILQKKSLLTRLEVVMLDARCVPIRPSIIALALIQSEMQRMLSLDSPGRLNHDVVKRLWLDTCQLQNISMISPNHMLSTHSTLRTILQNYDNNAKNMQRKRFKIRHAMRQNNLKPSENFSTRLCVIRE